MSQSAIEKDGSVKRLYGTPTAYGRVRLLVLIWAVVASICTAFAQDAGTRWDTAKANQWYQQQPWLVGANFVPSDAINELEMFQAATFNPGLIDKELGMADSIGMNTMRVFLQDQ